MTKREKKSLGKEREKTREVACLRRQHRVQEEKGKNNWEFGSAACNPRGKVTHRRKGSESSRRQQKKSGVRVPRLSDEVSKDLFSGGASGQVEIQTPNFRELHEK